MRRNDFGLSSAEHEQYKRCFKREFVYRINARNKARAAKGRMLIAASRTMLSPRGLDFLADTAVLPCFYCEESFAGGVDRMASNLGYARRNVAPCCSTCNLSKGNAHAHHVIAHAHKIVSRGKKCAWATWSGRFQRYSSWRGRHTNKPVECDLSKRQYVRLVQRPCRFCCVPLAHGIDRIQPKGAYARGNVQPACAVCNFAKGRSTDAEFLERQTRIAANHAAIETFTGTTAVGPKLHYFIRTATSTRHIIAETSREWRDGC